VDVAEQISTRATRVDVVYITMVGRQVQSLPVVDKDAEFEWALLLDVVPLDGILLLTAFEEIALEIDAELLLSVLLYVGAV
jgi:hypothetical protein